MNTKNICAIGLVVAVGACAARPESARAMPADAQAAIPAEHSAAIFAGGCFWCMEAPFESLPGVVSVTSGYAGGSEANPTYEQVSAGRTGHAEAVRIVYDPKAVDYAKLLEVYWHNIDPTVKDRQFCDTGTQYRTAIFVSDAAERALAEKTKEQARAKLGLPLHTEIVTASAFYPAEDDHQDYYRKNPERYLRYRQGCGRDRRLAELWAD